MARRVIKLVQDNTQSLDQEVEVHRIGKYNEGGTRPLRVRMRSQIAVEGIMARTGKLTENIKHKDIWIKKDMSLNEREKERALRSKRKEKEKEKDIDRED